MYEDELLEDLEYAEAEGAAELELEDEYEDELELEDEAEFAELEDYNGAEDWAEEADEFAESEDEYEDEYEGEYEDAELEDDLAYALGAEDADEFFKRLFRGIRKVARKVAPVIGRVARVAAPILSKIPHPYAQIAGRAAGLLKNLRAEGATEEEALDAMAELAAYDRRAVPLVAGIAARTLVKRRGATMPRAQRKQIVRTMNRAAKTLVRRRGPKAIRALAKVTKSVKRTAAAKGTPVAVRPKVVQRTAAKVARSPVLAKRLSKPSPRAKRIVRTAVVRGGRMVRSYTMPGPTRITITAV